MAHVSLPFAAYFGETESALATWRRLAPDLLGVQITPIWHPLYAEMRKLPGFKDLLHELGVVAYWRATGQWGDFARPIDDDDFEVFR
jgi:hypothetical protein